MLCVDCLGRYACDSEDQQVCLTLKLKSCRSAKLSSGTDCFTAVRIVVCSTVVYVKDLRLCIHVVMQSCLMRLGTVPQGLGARPMLHQQCTLLRGQKQGAR